MHEVGKQRKKSTLHVKRALIHFIGWGAKDSNLNYLIQRQVVGCP